MIAGFLLLILSQLFRISMQMSIANKRRTETWELMVWAGTLLSGILACAVSAVLWMVEHAIHK